MSASEIFWSECASVLTYLPFTYLFIVAFKKNLRFSMKLTLGILFASTVLRVVLIFITKIISSKAVILYNYLDLLIILAFAILIVNSSVWRMIFVGLVLKNTADAIVILAKFAEHLVNPVAADVAYSWTYALSLTIFDIILFPLLYRIINNYFTHEIRESISAISWRVLWLVPFFFYLTWYYVFYYSSERTDLEQACLPINSIFLFFSISCQYLIYICLARLVDSLHSEQTLLEENHAIAMQNLQYSFISEQLKHDQKLRHDFRHHLITISALAENDEYDQLKAYIAQYVSPIIWHSQIVYCSNTILNLMATFYANKCESNGIECYIQLSIPEQLPFSNNDITILFGNLLENAFDACMDIPKENPRKISFLGSVINNSLVFSIENTYQNKVNRASDNSFISTKHKEESLGISSCIDIVNKYNGSLELSTDDLFSVNLRFDINPSF